jgi:hypothetical protein
MPVFISYSHHDGEFAERLASQLVKHKAQVWIDKWKLNVGDSIIDRIQTAIAGASALLVVLSQSSVKSEWCKKELSAGLLRELEEKQVVVLPLLLEDCEIPLFLRGKKYADFRSNFDQGLNAVLESIARVTSESLGRLESPEWHLDWAVDWGMLGEAFYIKFTLIEQAKGQPFSALTEVSVIANDVATRRCLEFERQDLGWVQRATVIEMLVEASRDRQLWMILEDEKPKSIKIGLGDQRRRLFFDVVVTSRRLGEDTGRNIVLDVGEHIKRIRDAQKQASRTPTRDEIQRLITIQASLDSSA